LEYLEERGYTLVERVHRTRHGEIDLVMRDQETLV
jgi:Holliday junction resolvase-like predicted endonuclease